MSGTSAANSGSTVCSSATGAATSSSIVYGSATGAASSSATASRSTVANTCYTVSPSATRGCSLGLLELTPAPSRKRKSNVEQWQKSKQKVARNTGQEYVTSKKKTVSIMKLCMVWLLKK